MQLQRLRSAMCGTDGRLQHFLAARWLILLDCPVLEHIKDKARKTFKQNGSQRRHMYIYSNLVIVPFSHIHSEVG